MTSSLRTSFIDFLLTNLQHVYFKEYADIIKISFDKREYLEGGKNGKLVINHCKFARYLVETCHIQCADGHPFEYDFGTSTWKKLSRQEVERMIIRYMEELLGIENVKKHDKNTILEFLYTYAENEELKESLTLKNSFCFDMYLQDGIRDLKTNTKRAYSKSDFIMYKLPYHSSLLEENLSTDRREQFLEEILTGRSDKEAIKRFLQELIGWIFVPNSCFEIALLIHGSGCNGKGILLETIKHILGKDNSIGIGLHELNKEQNAYLLLNKLALIDSDMQQNVQLDSGMIKKLISGETIIGKMVYAKPISFSPVAKVLVGIVRGWNYQ